MLVKTLSIVLVLLFMIGCSDDAEITLYKSVKKVEKPLPCMRLVVFPPDEQIQRVADKHFHFTQGCRYRVVISKKSGIVCNSNQNAQEKALSSFPSGFIRLDLYDGATPLYSYYKDLTTRVKDKDIAQGLERLKKDMF